MRSPAPPRLGTVPFRAGAGARGRGPFKEPAPPTRGESFSLVQPGGRETLQVSLRAPPSPLPCGCWEWVVPAGGCRLRSREQRRIGAGSAGAFQG
ncbi:unnamed protein product [Lepidochelys kempii]